MGALSSSSLLDAWEQGLVLEPLGRGRLLLRAALPELNEEAAGHLTVGQRDEALLSLRESLFGSHVIASATCPSCRELLDLEFELNEIRISGNDAPATGQAAGREVLSLPFGSVVVRYRVPTLDDLTAASNTDEVEDFRRALIERCVVSVRRGGTEVHVADASDSVLEAVAEAMAAADPQADVELTLSCAACGDTWMGTFDIGSFLWSELDAWARRLVEEVHALATAYGWRESDIVAMSPRRRRLYLELMGA